MNPSPRSPKDVARNSSYEVMLDAVSSNYWPSADEIIVRHKLSGTYWRAVFQLRADDSDYEVSANWTEVRPEPITRVRYVPVSESWCRDILAERLAETDAAVVVAVDTWTAKFTEQEAQLIAERTKREGVERQLAYVKTRETQTETALTAERARSAALQAEVERLRKALEDIAIIIKGP